MQSAEHGLCKPALEHPRGEHIQSKSRDEACYSIDEVVRLNIDRSTAEQHVERQKASKKPAAATPGHNHQDGRHTDMRRREGGRRTLTHLLRTLHQIIEETMLVARPRQQLLIVIEVVADGGKDTVQHVLHADGRKVELRPCHRHKNVDEIVKEEGGDDDKRYLLQQVEAADEVPQHDDQHHGIVEEVTHVERFAHPDIGQAFGKPDGGLPAKEPLLGRSEHMVQIGEEAVELIRVGIPVGQERHLYRDAHKGGKLAGCQAVEIHQQKGHGSYQRTIAQHPQGMVHPLIQEQYQYRREQVVDERHLLYCKQPLAGIHHLEYI